MYKTILEPFINEIVIKKSRFIADTIPVSTEEEAKVHIDAVKKNHHTATHNVYVYLLGENYDVERYSGDGEPHGTAAIPVLDMYKKSKITNLCVVITRYFGGIKLGTGGLVRAYTGAAKEGLDERIVIVDSYRYLSITIEYFQHGKVEYLIKQRQCFVIGSDFSDKVLIKLYISEESADELIKEILLVTASTAKIEQQSVYGTIVKGKFIPQ